MGKPLALIGVFSAVIVYAPDNAQAIVSSYLPTLFLSSTEPIKLLLIGATLVGAGRIGWKRRK